MQGNVTLESVVIGNADASAPYGIMVTRSRERPFGRAAAACNVTQPALSSVLKALEMELGTPIVQRHERFEGSTSEGERIVEWCRHILADRGAMLRELESFRSRAPCCQARLIVPAALSRGRAPIQHFS